MYVMYAYMRVHTCMGVWIFKTCVYTCACARMRTCTFDNNPPPPPPQSIEVGRAGFEASYAFDTSLSGRQFDTLDKR